MSLLLRKNYNNRKLKKYVHTVLDSFFGILIKKGNKAKTDKLLKLLLVHIKLKHREIKPLIFLRIALERLKPKLNLRVKRVAGINYHLPCPIGDERANKMAVVWFCRSLELRKEEGFVMKAYSEVIDIYKRRGFSLKKRFAHEKLALDNRAFVNFLRR